MNTENKSNARELSEQELAQASGAADLRRNYTECPKCGHDECTKEYKVDIFGKPYYYCVCSNCGRSYDRAF